MLKNQLPRKMENIIELENIKKDIADHTQKIKDVQDTLEAQFKPALEFFSENEEILKETITEYKACLKMISEMDSYDDSLRHKYLRAALQ